MYSGICDQKGNKIFQGDIVADRRYEDVYYTVEFKNGMFTIDVFIGISPFGNVIKLTRKEIHRFI